MASKKAKKDDPFSIGDGDDYPDRAQARRKDCRKVRQTPARKKPEDDPFFVGDVIKDDKPDRPYTLRLEKLSQQVPQDLNQIFHMATTALTRLKLIILIDETLHEYCDLWGESQGTTLLKGSSKIPRRRPKRRF